MAANRGRSDEEEARGEIRSIKELVDSGLRHVPAAYIRPPGQRPEMGRRDWRCGGGGEGEGVLLPEVPVVSLSEYLLNAPAAAEEGRRRQGPAHIVHQIRRACADWGVFQVIDHGVSPSLQRQMWTAASSFFSLPVDKKLSLIPKDTSCPLIFFTGFSMNETVREWKDTLGFKPSSTTNSKLIPSFLRDPMLNFHNQVENLARTIGEAIATSLGLEANLFYNHFSRQTMGLNYYPACPEPELTFGLSSHSDFGSLTILMQDNEGLQVRKGDDWINVKPIPDSFVVLLGDQIEILTNGHYKSVEHRALTNRKVARMSIACFYGPNEDDEIGPINNFISDETPTLYRETKFSDYLNHGFGKGLNGKSNLQFSSRKPVSSR